MSSMESHQNLSFTRINIWADKRGCLLELVATTLLAFRPLLGGSIKANLNYSSIET
jgi:hypothetical protein